MLGFNLQDLELFDGEMKTTDDNPLLLKTEMGAGHAGPSGRYDAWRDEALVYAFLIDRLT